VARFLVKAVISAALIWLLLRHVAVGALAERMLAADRGLLLLAAAAYWAVGIPAAWRWSLILREMGHPLSFRVTFPTVLIGYFFSLTLPTSVGGDIVRAWRANRAGVPPAATVASVVIDRLTQFAAHLLLIIIAFVCFDALPDSRVRLAVLLTTTLAIFAMGIAMSIDRLPYLPAWEFVRAIRRHSADFRRILLEPRCGISVLLLGLANQGGVVLVAALVARALSLPVDLLQCLTVVPIALLMTVLPVSIAGWGVREAAFVIGFGFVGLPAPDALALSLLLGLVQTAVRLPGGILWLATGGHHAPSPLPLKLQ
jgi:uncharacterized membrane protein YbhN (UPF0104 family)